MFFKVIKHSLKDMSLTYGRSLASLKFKRVFDFLKEGEIQGNPRI